MTLLAAIAAPGWQRWFLVFLVLVYLSNFSPDFRDYQAVNLSRIHWARHKQILSTGLAILMLATLGVAAVTFSPGTDWILAGGILTVLVYRLLRLPRPKEPWAETPQTRIESKGSSTVGWLAMTPMNQIIRAPQLKTWLGLWGSCLMVVLVIDLISAFLETPDALRSFSVALTIAFMTAVPVMKALGGSLDTWILFGGGRIRWAQQTALIGLTGPVMVLIFGALYISVGVSENTVTTVAVLLGVALTFPILITLLELGSRGSTWWASLAFIATTTVLLVLLALETLGGGTVLGLLFLQYLGFAMILPKMALRHVPFTGGIRSWFGSRLGERGN
ncbi:hypothetical protein [Corynebacterium occultum]|nr:hypothetical protein [Corynebacterium occultum]